MKIEIKKMIIKLKKMRIGTKKTKIGISFNANSDLVVVEKKLKKILNELKTDKNIVIYDCFPTRKQVEDKGFSLDITNVLENIPKEMRRSYNNSDSFDEYMVNLPKIRKKTFKKIDKLYILGTDLGGVAEEIKIFTNKKIELL